MRHYLHYIGVKGIVGIVPAHYSLDKTHIVNHYTRDMLMELIEKIEPRYYYFTYDTMSYINPYSSDFLIILSNVRINLFKPYPLFVAKVFSKLLYKFLKIGGYIRC